jgi:uncharacterized protein YlxP (DUF503 family)
VVLAVRVWELQLMGCHSLKEKRSVLKPLVTGLRRGNASVAETAHQDLWQRAEVTCAVVGSDRTVVEAELRAADRMIEEADGVRIIDVVTQYR